MRHGRSLKLLTADGGHVVLSIVKKADGYSVIVT